MQHNYDDIGLPIDERIDNFIDPLLCVDLFEDPFGIYSCQINTTQANLAYKLSLKQFIILCPNIKTCSNKNISITMFFI